MAVMRTTTSGNGFLRCQCGTRIMLLNGYGECINCGQTAEQIMEARKRVCALAGCGVRFTPEHPSQRTCCNAHSVAYANQEQAKRRAAKREAAERSKSAHDRHRAKWAWLRNRPDEPGRRRHLLHDLEDKTLAGCFPYPDVLEVRPCVMDECPI